MVITVLSFKGGVGKSTIAQNLLVYFATHGIPTVLVDADENASSVRWHGVREAELPGSTVVSNRDPGSIVKMVKDLGSTYEHTIIDCPPLKQAVTMRSLLLADVCIIPLTPSGGADIWATEPLFEHIALMRQTTDREIPALVVFNRYQGQINLHKDVIEVLQDYQEQYGFQIAETKLGNRVIFGYANSEGLGVIETANAKAKAEMESLAQHIIENYG